MSTFEMVGLAYTRKCPMACRHCITESSPKADGKMSLERARTYLRALRGHTSSVCFTGGEPFLYFRDMLQLVSYASELELEVGTVTGAGWARDESDAGIKVGEMAAAGLKQLTVSWDPYHEEFGPKECAVAVARAALEKGLRVCARIMVTAAHDSRDYLAAFAGIPLEISYGGLARLGRAAELPLSDFHQYDSPPVDRCRIVFIPLVDFDGGVYACCGPALSSASLSPLILGNAEKEPLGAILERAKDDPILEMISLLGPHGLYKLLRESEFSHLYQPRRTYTSICDLCLDLTNSPRIVTALREQLKEPRGQVLLVAARMAAAARQKFPGPAGDVEGNNS